MPDDVKPLGDWEARRRILRAYWSATSAPVWTFLAARTILLPLAKYHQVLPQQGEIAEVGCGHGLVCHYLALRAPQRKLVGFDPDDRRLKAARQAGQDVKNLEFRNEFFREGVCQNLSGVAVIGVLCLLDDRTVQTILRAARAAISAGGCILVSDIPRYEGKDWVHRFHLVRERFLGRIGFTQGQGLYCRPKSVWETMIHDAGFARINPFDAGVFMHRTFDWLCQ